MHAHSEQYYHTNDLCVKLVVIKFKGNATALLICECQYIKQMKPDLKV
jgi:hypothetical protein